MCVFHPPPLPFLDGLSVPITFLCLAVSSLPKIPGNQATAEPAGIQEPSEINRAGGCRQTGRRDQALPVASSTDGPHRPHLLQRDAQRSAALGSVQSAPGAESTDSLHHLRSSWCVSLRR